MLVDQSYRLCTDIAAFEMVVAGLALLLILAGWLYYRGYNVSLPYMTMSQ